MPDEDAASIFVCELDPSWSKVVSSVGLPTPNAPTIAWSALIWQYLGCPSTGQVSWIERAEIELRSTPGLHHVEVVGSFASTMSTRTRAMPVSGWHREFVIKPLQQSQSKTRVKANGSRRCHDGNTESFLEGIAYTEKIWGVQFEIFNLKRIFIGNFETHNHSSFTWRSCQ